jgi:hypothetical protein
MTAVTVSFRDATTPLKMEYNARNVFTQLFGEALSPAERASRLETKSSLLDLVMEKTMALQNDLGSSDRAVLENYLDSVRAVEMKTQAQAAAARNLANSVSGIKLSEIPLAAGLTEFDKQVALMFDLIAIAYQADITRVASYIMVAEGSNRTYDHIGVPDSFHPVSHHADDPNNINRLVNIQTWHMEKFAEFLKRLSETPDGEGTLLDHSILLYGSNMGNSARHSNWPIPTVIVGGGNGKMKLGGQHIALPARTHLANVHLTLLNKAGIEQKTFADSTGIISEL